MNYVTLEVLHVPNCPNLRPMLDRLAQVTDTPVTTREVRTDAEATAAGMAGSPTLLANDVDPFARPGTRDFGISCRLYRDEHDRIVPVPSVAQLREAITAAGMTRTDQPEPTASTEAGEGPAQVLSTWRTRARPWDPVERAVHQEILRTFAATGHPPTARDLDAVAPEGERTVGDVLAALHEGDAIWLNPGGQIVVAYPFSATPTRHRVRISGRIDVYAMCAIDALGISAMLGEDIRIDSVDVTSGTPVTVTMTAGRVSWDPADAVVFIGADAGGGPSADCCCDHLNFFTDQAAATAWAAAHSQVPGQILTRAEAEALAASLFGTLLTANT